ATHVSSLQDKDHSLIIFRDHASAREYSDIVVCQYRVPHNGHGLGHHHERLSNRLSRILLVVLRYRLVEPSEPSISLVELDSVPVPVRHPMPILGKLLGII